MNLFAKAKELKLPARATLWYMVAAIIGKGVGFLSTPFFTRLMSGEEYGVFTLYLTILGVGSVICSAVYSGSGVYRAMQVYKNEIDSLIKSILCVTIAFSMAFCLLLFAFSLFFDLNRYILLPISLQLLCDGIVGVLYSKARFSYSYFVICTMSLISSVLPPVISVGILFFGGGAAVRIYSLLFVSVILALYAMIKLIYMSKGSRASLIRYSFRQALPILPHSVSSALSGQSDKLIIGAIAGSISLAKYSVAHSLGAATSFLGVAVGSALHPWIIRRLEGGRIMEIREVLTPVFSFLCAFSLMPVIFAPELIRILAPLEYSDAVVAVLPIALSCPPSFLIATENVGLVYKGKGKFTATLAIMIAVISVACSLAFTLLLGYFGAGLALLLSQTAGAALSYYFVRKSGILELFKLRELSLIFVFTSFVGLLALLLSDFLALRVILLIVPTVMLLNLFFGYGQAVFDKKISHPA